MAKSRDYYQVLGVEPRCHARVIEETYWERAHALHSVPTKKAQVRLGALNEAYETLGSPHKRAMYDQWRDRQETNGHVAPRPSLVDLLVSVLTKPFRPD
jgi:curved DNA-binding protein CbpA